MRKTVNDDPWLPFICPERAAAIFPFQLYSPQEADRPMKDSVAIAGVRTTLCPGRRTFLDEIDRSERIFIALRTAAVECRVHYDCGQSTAALRQ